MASTKQSFPCNTCNLILESSQTQRSHMRESWHIYNLKRRLASLPPISADGYATTIATNTVLRKQETSHANVAPKKSEPRFKEADFEQDANFPDLVDSESGFHGSGCLFCAEIIDDLDSTIEHMSEQHNFCIPEVESLSSLESFLKYLRAVINEYHECLYCGVTKDSASGIRRHMLNKGHCLINLNREPELLEFWELSGSSDVSIGDGEVLQSFDGDPEASSHTSQGFLRDQDEQTLPSGKVIRSKRKARDARILARRDALKARETADREKIEQITETDETALTSEASELMQREARDRPQELQVAVSNRDAVGLVGVSDQQVRGLVTLQRKMQRQEAVVRASASWADELGGRSQKHGKVKMDLRSG